MRRLTLGRCSSCLDDLLLVIVLFGNIHATKLLCRHMFYSRTQNDFGAPGQATLGEMDTAMEARLDDMDPSVGAYAHFHPVGNKNKDGTPFDDDFRLMQLKVRDLGKASLVWMGPPGWDPKKAPQPKKIYAIGYERIPNDEEAPQNAFSAKHFKDVQGSPGSRLNSQRLQTIGFVFFLYEFKCLIPKVEKIKKVKKKEN